MGLDEDAPDVALEGVAVGVIHVGDDIVPLFAQIADLAGDVAEGLDRSVVIYDRDVLPFIGDILDAQVDRMEEIILNFVPMSSRR